MPSLPLPIFGRSSSGSSTKSLRKLASKQRWSDLLEALDTPRGARQVSVEDFQGHLLLHRVVSHDPPVRVVDKLIEICPDALAVGGMSSARPLHCAVMFGSSADVVEALVLARTEAVSEWDSEGRSALHLAVCKACDACDGVAEAEGNDAAGSRSEEEERERALSVLEVLCRHCPEEAADLPDFDGSTALDVAISRERGENCPVTMILRKGARRASDDGPKNRPSLVASVESCAEGGNEKEWGESRLRELMEWSRQHSAPLVGRNELGPRAA